MNMYDSFLSMSFKMLQKIHYFTHFINLCMHYVMMYCYWDMG